MMSTRLCFNIVFIGLSLFVARVALGDDSKRLRILSYNIHHGEGVDGKLDLERIAGVIRSVSPDLVSLQEVDRKVIRSKSVDQPAELARLCDMKVVFEKNIELQGGEYGNAILSKLPILSHRNHPLPMNNPGEARGVLAAELKWSGHALPLLFLASHFDHRPDPGIGLHPHMPLTNW